MPLPASLLHQVENHACFPGVFHRDSEVLVCLDPKTNPQRCRVVSCSECHAKFGALEALLPPGMDGYALAGQLTQHLRGLRGYTLSNGGYHARGPGFWVSVVYFGSSGLFLVDGSRSRKIGTDLELLILGFQHGVLQPFDQRLLDPANYRIQTVHVNCAAPPGPVRNKQDLLSWPGCRTQAAPGFQQATLAEFLPLVNQVAATAAPVVASSAPAAPAAKTPVAKPAALKLGDTCPVCKAVVRRRPLLQGTYLGCLC